MIPQKDRIEAAIRHIQTATDVDPWAMELAVDALKAQGTCEDAVSRQTLQKELALYLIDDVQSEDEAGYNRAINDVQKMVLHLPSAQPEERTEKRTETHACDCVSRQEVLDLIEMSMNDLEYDNENEELQYAVRSLPSAKLNFDMTTKIDKAYDDGYKAGYLQAKHDWGDKDE